MNSPFALSFDEIKAQADANMAADRGQAAGVPAGEPVKEPAKPEKGKSFLEMVESAAQMLAQDTKKSPVEDQADVKTASASEIPADQKPAGQAGALSFDDMFANAQGEAASQMPSFGDMFAGAQDTVQAGASQVQGAAPETAQTPSFDDMFADVQNTAQADASQVQETAAGADQSANNEPANDQPAIPSFDEMFAQFQQASQSAAQSISFGAFINTPQDPESHNEQPAGDEAQAGAEDKGQAEETSVKESQAEEIPVQNEAEIKDEAPAVKEVDKAPAGDTAQAETDKKEAEAGKPAKRTRKSKKSAAKEEKKDPLPDITADFKVDVLGEGTPEMAAPAAKAEESPASNMDNQPLAMETLFTPDEIAAFRTDIRAFVRREFKMAMVGAVKELLKEFGE